MKMKHEINTDVAAASAAASAATTVETTVKTVVKTKAAAEAAAEVAAPAGHYGTLQDTTLYCKRTLRDIAIRTKMVKLTFSYWRYKEPPEG